MEESEITFKEMLSEHGAANFLTFTFEEDPRVEKMRLSMRNTKNT